MSKKIIITILIAYLAIGLGVGIMGEMRLARKYAVPYSQAFQDPWLYVRATAMAPFWPFTITLTLINCHNITGCPIDEEVYR